MCRVLLALLLVALNPVFAIANFRVEYLGIERGLSNNAVTCIYQDHRGFMWFGTYDGVSRYDGYTFKVYRNIIGDTNSLVDNHIYSLSGDRNQNLWIGAVKGLSVFNQSTSIFFTPRYQTWNNSGWKVMKDGVGIIKYATNANLVLAGTNAKGLLVFDGGNLSGKQIPLLSTNELPGGYTVNAIEIDNFNQKAWVLIARVGLCVYDFKTGKLTIVNSTHRYADCLKLGRNGSLWLGNNDGLYEYNINANVYSGNVMPFKNKITSLFLDKNNIFWIGSDGGGLWYLPATASKALPYLSEEGTELVNSNSIYSIYADADNRKWIGTLRGGVNIFHPRVTSFRTITYNSAGQNNSINNFILSFCEDEKNNVWIGTDGAGLRYWERKENKTTRYTHNSSDHTSISSNFITSIVKDAQNDIWISTWYGGINRLKKGSRSFERLACVNPVSNAEENNTWLVYEDAQKRIWTSTVNNGTLYIFNRAKNAFELFDEKIVNVQSLAQDDEGNLWAGSYTSLIRIDPLHKTHKTYNLNYPVRSIHQDKKHSLWVGTEGAGLLLFDRKTGSFKQFTTAQGLPHNTILRILEDDNGNLWMSTYNGLSKFDVSKNTFRNYLESDGLQSNQFSFNAGLRLKSGEFLFGGIRGFNIFQPDSVYDRKEAPPVFLTGISISNTPVRNHSSLSANSNFEKSETLVVPFDKATLSLEFLALEYTSADKIQYAYMLQGWDKDWINSNNVRTANYSRLQEGVYTFKIKATNADGEWGNPVQLIKVKVLPPWYRTWWAYLLYALTFAAGVYLYILYNKRQERLRYEVKLANLEKDKEKELTEKKISFFTHISHEFRTPLTLIINPLKELFQKKGKDASEKDISMIYRNARRLLSLVDQLLLFRTVESVDQQMRIERFDIVEACNEVHLSFCQHAEAKSIRFLFEKPGHPINIFGDKEKIEIILFNLLSNSFKYTKEGSISLKILDHEQNVELLVKDTGAGIPAEIGNKLFESFYRVENKGYASQTGFGVGLYVSHKLALAHHGKLSYTSQPGIPVTIVERQRTFWQPAHQR
jgi:signal transduction histidine kinase/ligand-binding sensor domain-containing protein